MVADIKTLWEKERRLIMTRAEVSIGGTFKLAFSLSF